MTRRVVATSNDLNERFQLREHDLHGSSLPTEADRHEWAMVREQRQRDAHHVPVNAVQYGLRKYILPTLIFIAVFGAAYVAYANGLLHL